MHTYVYSRVFPFIYKGFIMHSKCINVCPKCPNLEFPVNYITLVTVLNVRIVRGAPFRELLSSGGIPFIYKGFTAQT